MEVSKKPTFFRHLALFQFSTHLINFLSVLFSPNSGVTPILARRESVAVMAKQANPARWNGRAVRKRWVNAIRLVLKATTIALGKGLGVYSERRVVFLRN